MRPRIASSIWEPMIVTPVRNATPAQQPITATLASDSTSPGESAQGISANPAPTIAVPNSRSCGIRCASFGAAAIPLAKPTNTDTNSRPKEASPPPRLAEQGLDAPITPPPAANAPDQP